MKPLVLFLTLTFSLIGALDSGPAHAGPCDPNIQRC